MVNNLLAQNNEAKNGLSGGAIAGIVFGAAGVILAPLFGKLTTWIIAGITDLKSMEAGAVMSLTFDS